ncbi:T3SS effector HopA1 family protein [Aliiroseovarius crassostreae]|uniref:T3SS effector HopA1 family protein n=1 Tax=Aliiroseovarius crassostreae TaxID=154981 RepID=UPI0022016E34|nr:T3SS effector HopA1 family protein [Aliiroseovarius crassostreae]UWQ09225.1 hypothetical protein K3X25_06630 [Aliiroseovarius crassostreae]
MKQRLQDFVSHIRFGPKDALIFRDQPTQSTSTPEADQLTQVTEFVYKYLYTHPSGDIAQAFRATPPDAKLIAKLSNANTTRADVQQEWVLRTALPDGAVIAERFGKVCKFLPGQFLADPMSLPIRTGSALTVTHMTGTALMQPGFFHMFGQEQMDLAEQARTVRLYLNLKGAGAAEPAAALLTGMLNSYKIPFTCKFATRLTDYSRADTAVLYLPQRFVRIFQLAFADIQTALGAHLGAEVPAFTRRIAPGVGFAEDPTGEISFGAARSKLVAEAMLSSRISHRMDTDKFWSEFLALCAARGLDPDALHLNPGSSDTFYFPAEIAEVAA